MVLQIGATNFGPWEQVAVTVSIESMPRYFRFTAADPTPGLITPGQSCRVYAGKDLLITGFVDRVNVQIGGDEHGLVVTGRGLCQDLVDCSADPEGNPAFVGGSITASDTLDLAKKLASQFGIAVRSAVADRGKPIRQMQIALGESPYEIIERVCRWAGYLVYEDETGGLVLDRVGTDKMASGFAAPGNIENAQILAEIDQRFSDYVVVWNSLASLADLNSIVNQRAQATDRSMPRKRKKIIVSEQLDPTAGVSDKDFGQQRADWEMARRIGRSQSIALTCDSWRDSKGKIWTPNRLAVVNVPAADVNNLEWVIGAVTYRKDRSGTHADVILMPKQAYSIQPQTLFLLDREASEPPKSQFPPAVPGSGVQAHV